MSEPAPRIAALLPAATEIVCALGFRGALVARSHECDHPPGVDSAPAVTGPRIDVEAGSAAIDSAVRELVRRGLSLYDVDAERLRECAPDVVVTQTQCDVCAVTEAELEAAVREWTGARPRIVSLAPATLEDVFDDVRTVAGALDARERGAEVVDAMQRRIAAVRERVEDSDAPGVACIEWIDPLMSAGNWVPELVAAAGGRDLLGVAGEHSPALEWNRLREADPDAVLVMPCGFDLDRTRREAGALGRLDGWGALGAVRAGRVFAVDGHRYFNRPGPRLADSVEILAEILHPELSPSDHRGTGWLPVVP